MSTEPSSVEQDAERLFRMLFEVVQGGEKQLEALLTRHGLTTPQFYVLNTLQESSGRLSIGSIARRHGLTHATMTGLIKRMEQMNPPLVQREASVADRRSVFVLLTSAGYARFQGVQEALLAQVKLIFSLLPGDERQKLLADLERYISMFNLVMGSANGKPG
ncbi:MAG: MarR family transcriptional regulator [Anaerolineae bacterium]|nr:MarR family transcriptional regulator [Anaerolineae bacterium]